MQRGSTFLCIQIITLFQILYAKIFLKRSFVLIVINGLYFLARNTKVDNEVIITCQENLEVQMSTNDRELGGFYRTCPSKQPLTR